MQKLNNKAFSLLELIIGIAIFAMAVIPIFKLISTNMLTNSDLNKHVISLQLVRQKMEQLNTLPFSTLPSQSGFEARGFSAGNPLFMRTTSIESTTMASLTRIIVVVSWEGGSSSMRLETLRTKWE